MADTDPVNQNKLLIEAARTDDVDMLLEIFATGEFDINFQDGVGNTALHLASSKGSVDVMNELLEHDGCDVDYTNHIEGATPLHLAVKIKEPELRALIVDSLLDAGANRLIKDKAGQVPLYYVPEDDIETRKAFRRHEAQNSISAADLDIDDEEDDEEFSGTDEEE